MFNLDSKYATIKEVADVIKVLGNIMDTISKPVLQNKKDIELLKARIKDLENKWVIKQKLKGG